MGQATKQEKKNASVSTGVRATPNRIPIFGGTGPRLDIGELACLGANRSASESWRYRRSTFQWFQTVRTTASLRT